MVSPQRGSLWFPSSAFNLTVNKVYIPASFMSVFVFCRVLVAYVHKEHLGSCIALFLLAALQ